jgi:hypothetical protein
VQYSAHMRLEQTIGANVEFGTVRSKEKAGKPDTKSRLGSPLSRITPNGNKKTTRLKSVVIQSCGPCNP